MTKTTLVLLYLSIPFLALCKLSGASINEIKDSESNETKPAVIPMPNYYKVTEGSFNLNEGMQGSGNTPGLIQLVSYTVKTIFEDTGMELTVSPVKPGPTYLKLELADAKSEPDREAYNLEINGEGIAIRASNEEKTITQST